MKITKADKFVLENCTMSVGEILHARGSINNVQAEKILHKHMMDSKDVRSTMNQPYITLLCTKNPYIICRIWKLMICNLCNKQFSAKH
jgi:hypothetical protein